MCRSSSGLLIKPSKEPAWSRQAASKNVLGLLINPENRGNIFLRNIG
jgi:hypothetical protein